MERIKEPIEFVDEERESTGEDMLLAQIDAFREKAKQLQALTSAKQRKVKDLEQVLRQKEEQNTKMSAELEKKQKQADAILGEVTEQVDKVLSAVDKSMAELRDEVAAMVEDNNAKNESQRTDLTDKINTMAAELETLKSDIFEKIHTESVTSFRTIKDYSASHDDIVALRKVDFAKVERVESKVHIAIGIGIVNVVLLVAYMALNYMGVLQ